MIEICGMGIISNTTTEELKRAYQKQCKESEKRTFMMRLEKWYDTNKQKLIRKKIDILENYEYR